MPLKSEILILFLCTLSGVFSYECYVCSEQEDNEGKCAQTVEPCGFDQDYCLSEIRWGSKPFWEIGAPMQYFISKSCATEKQCKETINQYLPFCDHIWWKDWRCIECCKGDRCNYYVTLGSQSIQSSWLVLTLSTVLAVCYYFHQ